MADSVWHLAGNVEGEPFQVFGVGGGLVRKCSICVVFKESHEFITNASKGSPWPCCTNFGGMVVVGGEGV